MPKILLVDDSLVTREVMKVYLVSPDVLLFDASNGEQAMELIRREKPDLVLADMRMPRLDGPGLCRALQTDPDRSLAAIPVVILTSSRDAESRQTCLSAGAREVLTKPVQPVDLLAAVNRQLQRT